MSRIKYSIFVLFCVALSSVGFWYVKRTIIVVDNEQKQMIPTQTTPSENNSPEASIQETQYQLMKNVFQNVSFTSQAPSGEWSNPMFQDGCEEASMIMSMAWVQGNILTPESSKTAIESITQFETKKFGTFMSDTSAEDTAQIMQEYYAYTNITVIPDVSVNDIKTILVENAIIMAPMNGQALGNPNFTQPGPLHHMLVIIGYDAQTHEFVTNDPGTRKGESYRYSEDVLYGALRDYPTGNDEPLDRDNQKTIIVVKKQI